MSNPATVHLPPLPYPEDALAPHISADTVALHYGKHHAGYVANVNRLVAGSAAEGAPLEDLIVTTAGGLFNNAAQVWNHTFYWHSMHPAGGGDPSGRLRAAIEGGFGSVDGFRKQFADAACGHFGSGWVWLVAGGNDLEVMATANADLPQRCDRTPLLTIDVWEHAYYLDYRNARPAYVERWIEKLVNWEFAAANLAAL
ncbi:MAG: superoxide dismutase [Fe] [bacterium]|nr:superoxide dismutase [Fe] [bacterium]MCY3951208.1 superoxide dismutase [Fe] [bacterium]